MRPTKQQDEIINTLLAIHRELAVVDEVEYELQWAAKCGGPVNLTMHIGDYYYRYTITKAGVITYAGKSEDRIEWTKLKYFF